MGKNLVEQSSINTQLKEVKIEKDGSISFWNKYYHGLRNSKTGEIFLYSLLKKTVSVTTIPWTDDVKPGFLSAKFVGHFLKILFTDNVQVCLSDHGLTTVQNADGSLNTMFAYDNPNLIWY